MATGNDEAVKEIFELLLGRTGISTEDRFFEIGGHSMLAAELVEVLNAKFDSHLSLRHIYQGQTPKQIAAYIPRTT